MFAKNVSLTMLAFSLVCLGTLRAAETDTVAGLARRILDDTGTQGGLIVHLGCGDGRLTAALRATDSYLVHGLDADPANVGAARAYIRSKGLYGKVSIARLDGRRLPYVDNLVNLLVSKDLGAVSLDEVMRVLAPEGVAHMRVDGQWRKIVKPVPPQIDDWTHYLHDASNNAVAADSVVGPPRQFQWIAGPQWARSHDHLASLSAMVSTGGRIFYILDEGSIAIAGAEPKWFLAARDAFSGVMLWKRPISPWEGHLRDFRTGPTELARRLVAVGDRVYVTLGYGKPISVLDAATGETVKVYEQTENALEIIAHEDKLLVVVGDRVPDNVNDAARPVEPENIWHWWPIYDEKPPKKHLLAIEADSGKVLWKKADAETVELMPTTLAAAGQRAFFQNHEGIVAVDITSGDVLWRADRPISRRRPTWSAPTLVIHDDIVLCGDRAVGDPDANREAKWTVSSTGGISPKGQMMAFSATSGEKLWTSDCRESYNSPPDMLVAAGLVWSGNLVSSREPGITMARDLKTGEVARTRPADQEFFKIIMGHHRCYRNKATGSARISWRR